MIDKKSHDQLDQNKALHHHWQRAFVLFQAKSLMKLL